MPAETHSHTEPVTVEAVLDLLATILGDGQDIDPSTPLEHLGLGDELALLAFWDAVVEEHAERGVAEPDFEELADARTAADLAECAVRGINGHTGQT